MRTNSPRVWSTLVPGLCVVITAPGDGYMLYDAGHWHGSQCVDAVEEIIPVDQAIDLVVISHNDSDRLAQLDEILAIRTASLIMHTGYPRFDTASWRNAMEAIAEEVRFENASVISLASSPPDFGTIFPLGDAQVQYVAGWNDWDGQGPTDSEARNAISIVMRVDYAGESILLTGDTVGRRLGDSDNACKDAELAMVNNAANVLLSASVIIAPHHGGNNGSSACFIEAVDPEFVIFSAGHNHDHPTSGAADGYLAHGVPRANIFRTDLGDDEGGFEWDEGSIDDCQDRRGDDDVVVTISDMGRVGVGYDGLKQGC